MAATVGFKRAVLAIALAVAVGLGAVGLSSVLVSADAARDAVKDQIRAATGLDPQVRGPVKVSIFPPDTVSFGDVELSGGGGERPALAAQELTAHLRLLPLLIGHIEIADISLVQPRIVVSIEQGRSNWTPLLASLMRALKPNAERAVSFSEIHINDGTLLIEDAAHDVSETLDGVELSLAWPSISKSFAATGQFRWRDEPVEASVNVADFYAALSGDTSGLKFRLSGAPLKVAFDGVMNANPPLKLEGTLAADAASLRDALTWLGQRPPPGGGLGRFALKAETSAVGSTVALSGVNVELDGNAYEGVLSYSTDGRQMVQGTLAAEGLDLTPYATGLRLSNANAREWDRTRIALDDLSGFDVDLRLSAAAVKIGSAKLGRTAIATSLRNGRLVVTVGEAQAYGGVITGSVALARVDAGAEIKSQMQFANVDVESCFGELFGLRKIAGRGNFSFTIDAAGSTVDSITHALNGTITLTAADGALTGLNVEQLLRRLERRPLSGSGDFRSGRTPYDKINVALKLTNGIANLEDVRLDGTSVRLVLEGSTSIPARELDLHGVATLVGGEATFELPFVVQGPWDDPLMLPDPKILIQRSGAAAPLLDALRDRRSRDAVRSALERLTGGGLSSAKPAVPAAEPAPADK